MSKSLSRALRPYLHAHVKPRDRDVYLRFYSAVTGAAASKTEDDAHAAVDSLWSPVSYKKRLRQLTALHPDGENAPSEILYPRIGSAKGLSPAEFRRQTASLPLKNGLFFTDSEFRVQGMVYAAKNRLDSA